MVFHIAISYDIYLSGGIGQATLHITVAAISVLLAAVVVGKGGGQSVALGHWSGGQRAVPGCRQFIGK